MTTELDTEYCLGSAETIPVGEGREFDIAGRRIAVFRSRNGRIYATNAACPHRDGPLADGILGDSTLICPLHAWKFDLETGASIHGECGVAIYPAALSPDGQIVVTIVL